MTKDAYIESRQMSISMRLFTPDSGLTHSYHRRTSHQWCILFGGVGLAYCNCKAASGSTLLVGDRM